MGPRVKLTPPVSRTGVEAGADRPKPISGEPFGGEVSTIVLPLAMRIYWARWLARLGLRARVDGARGGAVVERGDTLTWVSRGGSEQASVELLCTIVDTMHAPE
jgi:hypothetical protein